MQRRNYFVILVVAIFGVGVFLLPLKALAQISIGISPLVFEITADPGEEIENFVKIYNSSYDSIAQIEMQLEDIAPTGEAGHVIVEKADTQSYSVAQWIRVEPKIIELQPREEKFVKFVINVPENAEPGGHYGTILASTKSITSPQGTGVGIVTRTGSLILVTVSGLAKENLTVKSFSTSKFKEYGPVDFEIKFENEGTVHVRPSGFITITNWLGQKKGDVEIAPRNVLPKAIRKFEASFPEKWLWAGKYTATLTGSYGNSNRSITPQVITFWAFPWKIGLAVLIFLLLFFLSRKRWIAAIRILIRGEN